MGTGLIKVCSFNIVEILLTTKLAEKEVAKP